MGPGPATNVVKKGIFQEIAPILIVETAEGVGAAEAEAEAGMELKPVIDVEVIHGVHPQVEEELGALIRTLAAVLGALMKQATAVVEDGDPAIKQKVRRMLGAAQNRSPLPHPGAQKIKLKVKANLLLHGRLQTRPNQTRVVGAQPN